MTHETEFRLFDKFFIAELERWSLSPYVRSVRVEAQGFTHTCVVPGRKFKPRLGLKTLAKRGNCQLSERFAEPRFLDGFHHGNYLYHFERPNTTNPAEAVSAVSWDMGDQQFQAMVHRGLSEVEINIMVLVELAIHEAMEMVSVKLKGFMPLWEGAWDRDMSGENDAYHEACEAKLTEYKTTVLWPHDRMGAFVPVAHTTYSFTEEVQQVPHVAF